MSETSNDVNVGWKDQDSSNGVKYRVKATDYDIEEASYEEDAPSASGPSFNSVAVNWAVGTEGAPSQDVQEQTSISYYSLKKGPWYSIYNYELTVVAQDTYHFQFVDQEFDTYALRTYQNSGSHIIEFNSNSPTIVQLSGN